MLRNYPLSDYCCVYGEDNTINIAIFGPVNPVFSGGDFCSPLVDLLVVEGYRVFVIDSLFFLPDDIVHENCEKLIATIAADLKDNFPPMSVIAGYALGGTIAQKLSLYLPCVPRLLSLSGPGYIDQPLAMMLKELVDLLKEKRLSDGLELLSRLVAPKGARPNLSHIDKLPSEKVIHHACGRMIKGFEFLMTLDARQAVQNYRGKLLCILGESTQLSTVENQSITTNSAVEHHQLSFIPDAGMRVLQDNPGFTLSLIRNWLSDEK